MTSAELHFAWLLYLLHWTARVLSLAVLGLVLLFFIGEGGFNPVAMTVRESVLMVFFLLTGLGLVVAWRWEAVGGALAILSLALFYVANWLFSGQYPRGWAFAAMIMPALLFLLCSLCHAGRAHNTSA